MLNAPMPYRLRLRFLSLTVEISCEDRKLLSPIRRLYKAFEVDTQAPTVRYELATYRPGAPHRYLVRKDGCVIHATNDHDDALSSLDDSLTRDVIAGNRSFHILHAAAISWEKGCIIFPGKSHSGKSTLAYALCTNSFSYLSDEFAPIHKESLVVHPFPFGIKLREGSCRVFSLPIDARRGGKGERRIELAGVSRHIGSDTPVTHVVFPTYRPGSEASLSRMSPAAALVTLSRCSLSFDRGTGNEFAFLSRLASSVPCFSLISGPIEKTVELVRGLTQSPITDGNA